MAPGIRGIVHSTRPVRLKRHAPYCSCPICGPVDKWCVTDGKNVFNVHNFSRAYVEQQTRNKQLKDGRYWEKLDNLPQELRESYLQDNYVKGQVSAVLHPIADCPFCASVAVLTCCWGQRDENHPAAYRLHYVICANPQCACSLRPRLSELEAINTWNMRAIQLRAVVRRTNGQA